jgi:hypothetical protein
VEAEVAQPFLVAFDSSVLLGITSKRKNKAEVSSTATLGCVRFKQVARSNEQSEEKMRSQEWLC